MVKICELTYPNDQEDQYKKYYKDYSYELHDFQKWTVEAIVSRNHVLICAPTGSGKTFGGDFSLSFFHQLGKKTIYTCPIKALSNEKFYQFSHKYPHIRFGLITGDIRCNPDADVLIMTTEILHNKLNQLLLKEDSNKETHNKNTSFEMNIPEELACVVFDEIHMIGDESRGTVWENTLMMLPPHIQIVGLSATLSNPERFAQWIENRHAEKEEQEKEEQEKEEQEKEQENTKKIVYLTKKMERAVPLTHYAFITAPSAAFKVIKDKSTQEQIRKVIDKPLLLQNANNVFNYANYTTIRQTLELFGKNKVRTKRPQVLNQLCKHMVQEDMFPALCYVFSRKQLEICSHEVSTNLLEFDSKVPYTVDRECETLLRERLPNFEEYLHLPEYVNLVGLLRKGIAIHHAGLMPVMKEMVELLFARGFVKLLFCTETMSVGINLPVKTTIFTDVSKFAGSKNNENEHRLLHSFEMTQAAGRAGRLGQDLVGNVIHLNNLFSNVDAVSYKKMLNGVPQQLTSKFRISYSLVLQQHQINQKQLDKEENNNLTLYANKSMMNVDMQDILTRLHTSFAEKLKQDPPSPPIIDAGILEEYEKCRLLQTRSVNKQRKILDKQILLFHNEYTELALKNAMLQNIKCNVFKTEVDSAKYEIETRQKYMQTQIDQVSSLLFKRGFLETDSNTIMCLMAQISLKIHEVPCLPFAELICKNTDLFSLNAVETISFLSCFTSVRVRDDQRIHFVNEQDTTPTLHKIVNYMQTSYDDYCDLEANECVNSDENYTMQYDVMPFMNEWCQAETTEASKLVLQKVKEKDIFLGEFVKAILKINSISAELEGVAEYLGNIKWLSVLKEIPALTLKFVVTNQSLYV